ncbi:MAG: hypothetical protein ABEJ05_14215 [Haloglomus sp.]
MVWVKSELAEELAVVAAWLSALIPWSVSVALGNIANVGTLVQLNFPFFLVRFLFNIDVPGPETLLLHPIAAIEFYRAAPGPVPFMIWSVAAGVLALAVLLSLAMYFFEDRVAAAPVDPVRVMGGLLLLSAVLLSAASFLLKFSGLPIAGVSSATFPGILLPIGVVFQYAFAYTLLRVERVDEPTPSTEDEDDGGPSDDNDDDRDKDDRNTETDDSDRSSGGETDGSSSESESEADSGAANR